MEILMGIAIAWGILSYLAGTWMVYRLSSTDHETLGTPAWQIPVFTLTWPVAIPFLTAYALVMMLLGKDI